MSTESEEVLARFGEQTKEITRIDGFPSEFQAWALCHAWLDGSTFKTTMMAGNESGENLGSFARIWNHSGSQIMRVAPGVSFFKLTAAELRRAIGELEPVVEALPDKPHENFRALHELALADDHDVASGSCALVFSTNKGDSPEETVLQYKAHLNRSR